MQVKDMIWIKDHKQHDLFDPLEFFEPKTPRTTGSVLGGVISKRTPV